MDWLEQNRAYWDERAPLDAVSRFDDVAGFIGGDDTLRGFELEQVGDVTGRTLLHLMCHMGLDTLSWARRGARVTGLDFCRPALGIAADLAAQTGLDEARFVTADIDHAAEVLRGETFDIVYTGKGAIEWLPDLDRWAGTVAALIAPGGKFYLAEYNHAGPGEADDTAVRWTHPIDGIVNALVHAGLRIDFLYEHPLTEDRLRIATIPLMFSLHATKPA
ncbi:MAG TPA: class I SAM-dependent methyltransferase [Actinospica sp.]|nr:class I SAM-dependent methyltransferase [Actinospica sp.]